MAAKSANLYARIEPDVKEQAESILSALGIPASNAINMLSEAELNAELEKGYADIKAGRTREASAVFADIRKDYDL